MKIKSINEIDNKSFGEINLNKVIHDYLLKIHVLIVV